MKKITQKEIAAKLGLHVRTISRVLNHDDTVKPETRQRVVAELNRNGYFFQTHCRPEVVAVDIRPGYLEDLALRLIKLLSNRGLSFKMTDHKADLRHFHEVLSGADMVVFCSTPSAKIIEETGQRYPDLYRINLSSHGVPGAEVSIEPGNDAMGKRSARYLADCGHRDILVLSSRESMAVLERTKSFLGEMAVSFPDVRCRTIMGSMGKNLSDRIAGVLETIDPRPSAVYCPALFIAWHTLHVLIRKNIRVPDEISVLMNDLPDDFAYEMPFQPDTVYSKTSDIIDLAEFYITNRMMLKNASSVVTTPGIELRINGTVARLKR